MADSGRRSADELLAVAMASGQTLRGAAVVAGIAERTAARRWADPVFRRRVSDHADEYHHVHRLQLNMALPRQWSRSRPRLDRSNIRLRSLVQ